MAQPNLTINNGKPTEFEFDVMIQGATANESAVRFVVESAGYDVVVNCAKGRQDKWLARIPALDLQEAEPKYRVEVITGGYFFTPTSGTMQVIRQPRVSLAETMEKVQIKTQKPSVKASSLSEAMNRVEVSIPKKPILVETMSALGRTNLQKKCGAAGRIFARAGEVMENIASRDQRKMTTQGVTSVLEAVKKAITSIEG
jgi:hypothetical protein